MKPHPKIRKTIKWGGAAVTVLLVVVWIGSYFAVITCANPTGSWWDVCGGEIRFGRAVASTLSPGWHLSVREGNLPLVIQRGGWYDGSLNWINAPLWMPLLPVLAATVVCWRLDTLARRRASLNLCPKCNYDRAGLGGGAGAVCPECGERPTVG